MNAPIEIGRGERVTVVLEPALRAAVSHEARRSRRSVSNFIRNLIADAVERGAREGDGQRAA
jgi:predicted transcriptional regulator